MGGGDTAEVYLHYNGAWEGAALDSVSGTSTGWAERSVSIDAAIGYGDVMLKFEISESGQNSNLDWAIDDVVVNESNLGPDLILYGEDTGDNFGWSVSTAGDVDNDTIIDDIIVGAPNYGDNDIGRAYIYNGTPTPDNIVNTTLTGETAGDNFGWAVAYAGKVNGVNDSVIIGAPGNNSEQGAAYICYGGESVGIDVRLIGINSGDKFGYSVACAGDMNNDGTYDDVIIGAPYNDAVGIDAGAVYIFYGSPSLPDKSASAADHKNYGDASGDHFGWAVFSAGDVDGNGWSDVIIGAPDNDEGGNDAGKAYVFTTIPEFAELIYSIINIFILIIVIKLTMRRKYKIREKVT